MTDLPQQPASADGLPRAPLRVAASRTPVKWDLPAGKIGAAIAESDFGTAPAITAVLHAAVDEGFLTYLPEATGCAAQDACAAFQRERYGWDLPTDRVHLVPDVVAALRLTIEHFTRPGSAVVVPTPAYTPFLRMPQRHGREVIEVPSTVVDGRWVMDLEGIDRAFAAGAGLLLLCNPHNPLGQVLNSEEMAAVSAVVERHGARVFADEIHAPIVYAGIRMRNYAASSPEAARHTVTATATSKGWNVPGLKCAQLILTSEADEALWREADPMPLHVGSTLGALAAATAYADDSGWLDETVGRLDENRMLLRRLLDELLPEVVWTPTEATYLAWLDLRALGLPTPLSTWLDAEADVVVIDGADCGTGFEGWVRFNFALPPATLERAIRSIAAAARARIRAVESTR